MAAPEPKLTASPSAVAEPYPSGLRAVSGRSLPVITRCYATQRAMLEAGSARAEFTPV